MHVVLGGVVDTVRTLGWSGAAGLLKNGLVLGSLYALIALGYTMVYGILKLLNFAHGDVYMVGAFLGYGVLTAFGGPLNLTLGMVPLILLMFAAAMGGSGVLGVAVERFAYRPLRNAPRIAPLISALGVAIFLENSAQLLTNGFQYNYDSFDLGGTNGQPGPLIKPVFTLFANSPLPVSVSVIDVLILSTAVALMVGLIVLVNWSRFGKAMRATAYDREAASMMGIDTDRVISKTFFIASALAGAAGVMVGLKLGTTFFLMGFVAGLKAFTAAVVGGIGSIPGAVVGGLLIGVVESFAAGYVGGQWSDIVVFGLLVLFMLVRPTGLLGSHAIQKV
ncbi:MAG: branched-chain amino acid transport system permease protein [Gaiellaceae bacterium]|jgi:branched-chain amino acid transport system permease protein|nr:branched-chain amino acid transport system permease protein [Gaiellaceae bacterium]